MLCQVPCGSCKNKAHCIGDQKSAILLGSPKFHDIKARNPNDAFAWFIHKIIEPMHSTS